MQKFYNYVIFIDNYFIELEEWISRKNVLSIKKAFAQETGQLDDILEIKKHEDEVQRIIDVIEQKVIEHTGTGTLNEARLYSFEIKAIWNAYCEKAGEQYFDALSEKTPEQLEELASSKIREIPE